MQKVLKMLQMKKIKRPERILIDTCFWIALYNERDGYHNDAEELFQLIVDTNIIIPWPTLYETINTRLSKNYKGINKFDKIIKMPNTILLEDVEYKERALQFSIENSTKAIRPISLVDAIIREIIADVNINIDYLITYNKGDFIDLCQKRKVEILND